MSYAILTPFMIVNIAVQFCGLPISTDWSSILNEELVQEPEKNELLTSTSQASIEDHVNRTSPAASMTPTNTENQVDYTSPGPAATEDHANNTNPSPAPAEDHVDHARPAGRIIPPTTTGISGCSFFDLCTIPTRQRRPVKRRVNYNFHLTNDSHMQYVKGVVEKKKPKMP